MDGVGGNDTLVGNGGLDSLCGEDGNDISYDTAGRDLYLFNDDAHGDRRLFLSYLVSVDPLSAADFTQF